MWERCETQREVHKEKHGKTPEGVLLWMTCDYRFPWTGKKLGHSVKLEFPTQLLSGILTFFILEFQDTEVSLQVLRKDGWPTPCRDCFWLSIDRVFFSWFFSSISVVDESTCMFVCQIWPIKSKGIIELQVCQSATSNEGFVPTPSWWHFNQSTMVWRPGTMKDLGLKKRGLQNSIAVLRFA